MIRSVLLLFISFIGVESIAQQVFKTTAASTIAYLEYLPEDYQQNSDKYPIMFFLHGNGEKGANTTDTTVLKQYIDLVTKHGPPKYIKSGYKFPFIVISPQLKTGNSNWTSAYIMEVINHCKNYLRIDEKRIYLTGLSLGGGGTWVAAQDYPALFAAIAPVCGGYNSTAKACGIANEDLPVWAFHGDKDSVVPLSRSQNMVNAINACTPAPSPLAKFTIYPGVGHNAWDYAYRTDSSLHTPNVYGWLSQYKNTLNGGNIIPSASAGSDKTTSGASITLTGSGQDADGSITSYQWTQIAGAPATLSGLTSSTLSAGALRPGKYVFRLRVTDDYGNTDSDYVSVKVSSNLAPIVSAGNDHIIRLPIATASFAANATDSDGVIATYAWTKIAGPEATLTGLSTKTLGVSNTSAGIYTFRITVTDDAGAKASDDVTLEVLPTIPPTVSAGKDKLHKLPSVSNTIIGTATDDGGIAKYQWSKVSGPGCTLYNANTSSLRANALVSGVYTFRLTVTDNDGNVSSDDMVLTVDDPPVVNAGVDQTVYLPLTGNVILTGQATDSDGTIVKYFWSKYSGPAVSMTGASTPALTITQLVEGSYIFKLAVTDNVGATTIDYVTVSVTSIPPVSVSAGEDRIIKLPTTSAAITGVASVPNGTILSYAWTKLSGPACSMNNSTTSVLKLSGLVSGTYSFRMTVKDSFGQIGFDDVQIVVDAPPLVNAGVDKTINLPMTTPVILNGSATDSDGQIVKYTWSKYSGPNVSVSNVSTKDMTINVAVEGIYVFKLAVTDNLGATGFDYVTVTVKNPTTTAMSIGETEVVENGELDFDRERLSLFSKRQFERLADMTVTIFNENGNRIFEGVWTAQAESDIMNVPGLYIYRVTQQGALIESGKVFKTR